MSIDQRSLRAFVLLSELGTLSKVAERLNMSVASASRVLSQLQHDIGITLYEQKGRELDLTIAGRLFLTKARESLNVWRELSSFGKNFTQHNKLPLRLISFTRYADALLCPTVSALIPSLSNFQISIDIQNNRDFETLRYMHPFDFGVGCLKKHPDDDLVIVTIGQSPLVVCVSENSTLAKYNSIKPELLESFNLICLPGETLIGSAVNSICPFINRNQVIIETSNTLMALSLVSENIGIHITDLLVAQSYSRCKILKLDCETKYTLPISCFWPKNTNIPHSTLMILRNKVEEIFHKKCKKYYDI